MHRLTSLDSQYKPKYSREDILCLRRPNFIIQGLADSARRSEQIKYKNVGEFARCGLMHAQKEEVDGGGRGMLL